jgi:hypothetical protein
MWNGNCTVSSVSADAYINSFSTSPICTLDELFAYPTTCATKTDKVKTKTARHLKTTSNQLLVCHDMRGNYLSDRCVLIVHDDCFMPGTQTTFHFVCRYDTGSVYDEHAFEITNWSEVDIFCYFSHNFVTIPPSAWVRTCRRHHSRVLGTLITEWEAGRYLYLYIYIHACMHTCRWLMARIDKRRVCFCHWNEHTLDICSSIYYLINYFI